jgi:hypothetical protein
MTSHLLLHAHDWVATVQHICTTPHTIPVSLHHPLACILRTPSGIMKFVNFSLASLLAAQPAVAMTVKGVRKQNDPARNLKKTKNAKKAKKAKNPTVAPTVAPNASPTIPAPEALVCYSSETTTLASTEDAFWDMRSIDGALDFGVISVPAAGGDVMLDINASTGGVIDRGNDLDGKKMSYAFYSGYFVGLWGVPSSWLHYKHWVHLFQYLPGSKRLSDAQRRAGRPRLPPGSF